MTGNGFCRGCLDVGGWECDNAHSDWSEAAEFLQILARMHTVIHCILSLMLLQPAALPSVAQAANLCAGHQAGPGDNSSCCGGQSCCCTTAQISPAPVSRVQPSPVPSRGATVPAVPMWHNLCLCQVSSVPAVPAPPRSPLAAFGLQLLLPAIDVPPAAAASSPAASRHESRRTPAPPAASVQSRLCIWLT